MDVNQDFHLLSEFSSDRAVVQKPLFSYHRTYVVRTFNSLLLDRGINHNHHTYSRADIVQNDVHNVQGIQDVVRSITIAVAGARGWAYAQNTIDH